MAAVTSVTTAGSCSGAAAGHSKNVCRWTGCSATDPFDTVQELVEHVNQTHVDSFQSQDFVLCLWEGCKVYNVPCQKKQWLAQHMRRHTNERPHKCIMNGCNQSFWNVDALTHHLQLHLLPSPQSSSKKNKKPTSSPLPSLINTPPSKRPCLEHSPTSSNNLLAERDKKSLHLEVCLPPFSSSGTKSSKVICSPPQPVAVNGGLLHNDVIDSRVASMIKESVLTRYLRCSQARSDMTATDDVITLIGQIIGRRQTLNGSEPDFLINWSPRIVPDSWIPSSDYTGFKTIAISELKHCQQAVLVQCRYLNSPSSAATHCWAKRRRKRSVNN